MVDTPAAPAAAPSAAPAPATIPGQTQSLTVHNAPSDAAPAPAPSADIPAAPASAPAPAETPAPLVTPPEPVTTVLNEVSNEGGVIEYEPTGDAALDVALSFLGNLGFAGDSDAMQRAARGDFDLLEAQLAAMGVKSTGWERMVALAKSAHSASEAKRADTVKATEATIVSIAGTREHWGTVVKWAAENATAEEKAELNAMIDAGGFQARAAATTLMDAYNKANGEKAPRSATKQDAAGVSPSYGQGPLNSKDYGEAVRALHAKLGSRMEGSPEYADLQRRLR